MSSCRRLIALLAFFIVAPSVQAFGCVSYPTQGVAQTLSFGTVRVPNDAPVGTVLAQGDTREPWGAEFFCDKAGRFSRLGIFSRPSPIGQGIHDTNVPGVGIRIRHFGFQLGFDNVLVPAQDTMASWAKYPIVNAHFRVELIKTGPVVAGGELTPGTIAEAGYDGHTQWWASVVGTRIEPERATCGFVSRQLVFDLGDVDAGSLLAEGHSRWANQTLIGTGCATATEMRLTFNGAADLADPTLFRVDDVAGGAHGVAVELRSESPDAQALPNVTASLSLPAGSEGRLYGFRARYRATGTTLTAGSANLRLTVDVAYR